MLENPRGESNTLEIVKVAKDKRELIEIVLHARSISTGKCISELGLPEDTVVALVARGESTLIPKGSTVLRAEDQVFVITKLLDKNTVETCFYGDT